MLLAPGVRGKRSTGPVHDRSYCGSVVDGEEVPGSPPSLVRLPDGTVKHTSPLTGTEVWSVPRRAHRPLTQPPTDPRPLRHPPDADRCAFCPGRYLETPPEKARLVADDGGWHVQEHLGATEVVAGTAEVRRFPNLFEIVSVDYWRTNHGFVVPDVVHARAARYLADPLGREHVAAILRRRAASAGADGQGEAMTDADVAARAADLFAGAHDVVVARRHLVDGARSEEELAGPGTLTPDEHARFVAFTVDAMRSLYAEQPHARYVAAFQNWLRPAGASFDHLHKQLLAIDELGPRMETVLDRLRADPDVVRRRVLDHAEREGLVVARTAHAVAVAALGHAHPAFEVWSLRDGVLPWEHSAQEVREVSDLLHALHAATGTSVPSNEEWHHRPPGVDLPLPWHVVLRRRDSTAAGFEGATGIHVTTIDPRGLREVTVERLRRLRGDGVVAALRLGDEPVR
jgi:galactose-1-phosphate uridylyltransferase